MQLPEISDTGLSNVVRLADGARKTRVLYAGDMEFAKAQFASVAPQLQLIPIATVLNGGADAPRPPADVADVALIDCGAAGVDARAVVDGLRARGLDLPVVLALDPGGAADGAPSKVTSELRVDDYTVKLPGWLARLTSRLEFAIAHQRRRRSLDQVQAASERLRTIVETAPVCLARVARDGTILAMNEAAVKMVCAGRLDDVLGKSLLSFVEAQAADGVTRFIDTVSAGQPGSLEFAATGCGATARVVDARAVPLSTDAEGRSSALLVLRDMTERKRLEESMLANAAVVSSPHAEEGEQLRRDLEASQQACRRLEAERDEAQGQLDEARARAAMIDHVRAACTAAEQQIADMQAERDRTAGERAAEREQHQALVLAAEAERAQLASRCEALEGQLRRSAQDGAFTAEREALQASLGALRTQFNEISAALDAAERRHEAALNEQRAATAAAETQLRLVEEARAALAVERDQLRGALETAQARTDQLQAVADDLRQGRESRFAENDATRRALAHRVEELQARVTAAAAERDAMRDQLHAALEGADARSEQLQSALSEVRARHDAQVAESEVLRQTLGQHVDELQARVDAAIAERDALRMEHTTIRQSLDASDANARRLQAALDDVQEWRSTQSEEGDAIRRTFTHRIEELQTRLDAVLIERDTLARSLDDVRTDLTARLIEATAEGEGLRRRLEEHDDERARLRAEHAALREQLQRDAPAVSSGAGAGSVDLHDAKAAFREAFQLLSGELQNAVQTTRAQQAALLRAQPATHELLEEQLRQMENECRRLTAERDERETTVRALQREVEQLIGLRREQRKELVRALQESNDTERRAAERLAECARLRQMLHEAQAALQRLSKWAANQSTRLASPVAGQRTAARLEAPASRAPRNDDDPSPSVEKSWS